ncbi:MAG: hypothetical protein MI920_04255 [Kiloniellales bacterium]|nr:hypothetical protein [Kiloniellales bacterium]
MPEEIRTIIFDADELLDALSQLAVRKGAPVPNGSMPTCRLRTEPSIQAVLTVEGQCKTSIEFSTEDIGAALMLYCIKNKIPLPLKNAVKGVKIIDKAVALVVTVNAGPQRLAEVIYGDRRAV